MAKFIKFVQPKVFNQEARLYSKLLRPTIFLKANISPHSHKNEKQTRSPVFSALNHFLPFQSMNCIFILISVFQYSCMLYSASLNPRSSHSYLWMAHVGELQSWWLFSHRFISCSKHFIQTPVTAPYLQKPCLITLFVHSLALWIKAIDCCHGDHVYRQKKSIIALMLYMHKNVGHTCLTSAKRMYLNKPVVYFIYLKWASCWSDGSRKNEYSVIIDLFQPVHR